jgi:hypothetical protein
MYKNASATFHSTVSLTINMSSSRKSHNMTLRRMSINADEEVETTDTPQLPATTQTVAAASDEPVAATQSNSQTDSPLFLLPPELRNCIYAHVFELVDEVSPDGVVTPIDLDTVADTVATDQTLLQTCQLIYQEAKSIFDRSLANQEVWENSVFVINLSDDWESEHQRAETHFEVVDLLDEPQLCPELSDKQVDAIQNLLITVRSDLGEFEAHLNGRIRHLTRYWDLDDDLSTLEDAPTLPTGPHSSHGVMASTWPFDLTLLEIYRAGQSYAERVGRYLTSAELQFGHASNASGASGRHYQQISARQEMQVKIAAKRTAMAGKPPQKQGSVKRRQFEALLQHCWIVWRARRAKKKARDVRLPALNGKTNCSISTHGGIIR